MKSRGQSGAPTILIFVGWARIHRDGVKNVGMGLWLEKIMEEECKVLQEKPSDCDVDLTSLKRKRENQKGTRKSGLWCRSGTVSQQKTESGRRMFDRRTLHWAEMARLWDPPCAHCLEVIQEEPHLCSKCYFCYGWREDGTRGCQLRAHLASSFLKGDPRGIFSCCHT